MCLASPSRPNQLTQNRLESIHLDTASRTGPFGRGPKREPKEERRNGAFSPSPPPTSLKALGLARAVVHRLSAAVKTPLYSSKRRSQAFQMESEKKGARLTRPPASRFATAILRPFGSGPRRVPPLPIAFHRTRLSRSLVPLSRSALSFRSLRNPTLPPRWVNSIHSFMRRLSSFC